MTESFIIRIEPHRKEVTGQAGETVLQALMNQFYGREGRAAFYGCRRGGCASCKVELLSGDVDHSNTYSRAALTDEERSQRYILACQSFLRSDISIRILKRDNILERLRRTYSNHERLDEGKGGNSNG